MNRIDYQERVLTHSHLCFLFLCSNRACCRQAEQHRVRFRKSVFRGVPGTCGDRLRKKRSSEVPSSCTFVIDEPLLYSSRFLPCPCPFTAGTNLRIHANARICKNKQRHAKTEKMQRAKVIRWNTPTCKAVLFFRTSANAFDCPYFAC